MKRIRNLGLVALAALALTAVAGVSSASATSFGTDEYPSYIEGHQSGAIMMTSGGAQVTYCTEPLTLYSPPYGPLDSPVNTLVSASDGKLSCKTSIGSTGWENTTFELNGCNIYLQPGPDVEADRFGGTLDIGPPGCGPIRHDKTGCDTLIPAQTDRELGTGEGQGFQNQENAEGSADDTVDVNVSTSLIVTPESKSCGQEWSSFTGAWNVDASEWFGGPTGPTGLRVSQIGAFLDKETFDAEQHPALLVGAQDPEAKHVIQLGARPVECSGADFSSVTAGAASTLSVDAQYEGCITKPVLGVSFNIAVDMNSCNYVLNAAGTAGLACDKEGDAVELVAHNSSGKYVCTITMGPQSGVSGVEYTNVGEGNDRGIEVSLGLKSLTYSVEGSTLCGKIGTSTNGTYSGGMNLFG